MFGKRVSVSELPVGSFLATSGLEVVAVEKIEGTPYYSVTLKGYRRPSKVRFHGSETLALV